MEEDGDGAKADDPRIDGLIEQFNGDARAVIGALLNDLDILLRAYQKDASAGFSRRGSMLDKTPFANGP